MHTLEYPMNSSKASEMLHAIVNNVYFDPAMEMLYSTMRQNVVYTNKKHVPLPREDEDGRFARGNIIVMLTPSQKSTIDEIKADYLNFWRCGFKWYTTDTIFREKIGRKRITKNITTITRREWENTDFPHPIRFMTYQMRKTKLAERPNLILDLGGWTELYFRYSFKVSIPVIIKNYINFLKEKLNDPIYADYGTKVIYIPLNQWFSENHKVISFRRDSLDNPLSILLFAAYRFPELLAELPKGLRLILGDSQVDQFVMYPIEFLNKANFAKIRSRIKMLKSFRWDDESEIAMNIQFSEEEEDEESEFNNTGEPYNYPDPKKVIPEVDDTSTPEEIARKELMEDNRARIINDAKRNLVGRVVQSTDTTSKPVTVETTNGRKVIGNTVSTAENTDDMTSDVSIYDEDDVTQLNDDTIPIIIDEDGDLDDDVMDAVDDAIAEMQEDNPDVLLNENGDFDTSKVQAAVQAQIRKRFTPEVSPEQAAKIEALKSSQDKVIRKPTTAEEVKSKEIQTTDLTDAVDTTNDSLLTTKFANFDKSYNEQKLESDMDAAVAALSNASSPVFVIDKQVEDTSDQLNLRKTITYTLQDTYGGKHTIKVDVPTIIENNYIYVNGSKIVLGHQLMLMPIVKTGPAEVQIVSWYSKMTLRREGNRDSRTEAVKKFLFLNSVAFDLVPGNATHRNTDNNHVTTLDIDSYARSLVSFTIGTTHFILDRQSLLEKIPGAIGKVKVSTNPTDLAVGYDTATKEIIYVTSDTSLTDHILNLLSDKDRVKILKLTKTTTQKILRTTIKVQGKAIPLIVLLFFYEGFTEVMKKAEVLYHVIPKGEGSNLNYDKNQFDCIELEDSYIIWERNPIWNTMLMNGLAFVELRQFTFEEMDERETWANVLSNFYSSKNVTLNLLQFYDFMIDPVTEEILNDFNLPTKLVPLLLLANKMLADNSFTPINHASAIRIRSNEVIAQAIYRQVTNAYKSFRATEYKATSSGRGKPNRIAIKQTSVIRAVTSDSQISNEVSDLNPILTIEKNRSVTPKGPTGVNKDRAMTLKKRAYDKSMLGIVGVTTPPDAKVGITRQLTLEPNVTSVRGYVKIIDTDEELDKASNANLLTPAELLSPPGVLHDDGPRIAMSYKQSQYMVPVEGSCPVFFGNKVEAVLPYHLDNNFTVVAKDDGEVVEKSDGIVIIKYSDGTHEAIDTNFKMKKNSSGFYVKTHLECTLEVGDNVRKNEVVAYDPRAFTKNSNDLSASMNIGVPIKVAIMGNYDIYEDSSPITESLSEKFTTYMSMKEGVGIPAQSYVESMVDVGDYVEVDQPLIVYDPAHDDEETNAFLQDLRSKLGEELGDIVDLAAMPQVRAEYAGTISNIEVYSSVEMNELSPSLQAIFEKYTAHAEKVNKILNKYKNPGDQNYYKCGQIIRNAREVVSPDYGNRVKGYTIGDDGKGLVIIFHIEFKDIAKAGDKGSAFTALKFTTSHKIPKGREPYSEYRPEEEISALISPLSVLARKTPSIWETMSANKCLIEMTRHALEIYFNDSEDGQPKNWKK